MLKIFNTLGRELQEFKPIEDKKVTLYHCGPTVYWTQHIGNMRGMLMGDLIRRTLVYLGYEVETTRNYTDVGHLSDDGDLGEDKMEKGAKRENRSPKEIADTYIQEFDNDTNALNIIPPTYGPRATDYVQQMIDMVQELLHKEFAYSTSEAIYFDTSKAQDYTRLSGQKLEFQEEGAGHGEASDENKKNPADFALWFFKTGRHAGAIQTWQSPFESPEVQNGEGFPGWHIECSAMAKDTLGNTIDLHLGGIEHIPVHHTNEIAQSEAVNEAELAHYWLHNEHLTIDGGKMAKSEGTAYSLSDLTTKGYNPLSLRYFFLQAHYRSKQNFTWQALDAAATAFGRLVQRLGDLQSEVGADQPLPASVDQGYQERFIEVISNDFNVPAALALTWDMLKDENLSAEAKVSTALDFDRVLGLKLESMLANPHRTQDYIPSEAQKLLKEREQARQDKDWQRSDELRDRLDREFEIEVKDTENGQIVI